MSDITPDDVKRYAHFFRRYGKREAGGLARRTPITMRGRAGQTLHEATWLQLEHPQAFANRVHAFEQGRL